MKAAAIIVILAVLAIGLFWAMARTRRPAAQREFRSTDEFIQWLASEAVADASKENNVTLDYSVDSIKKVEEVLGKLHDRYTRDPSSLAVKGLSSAYGAYIGEVIRRSEPGAKWERDDPVAGEKSYPLQWGAGSSYPMAWCYKRIVDGSGDNVWVKYMVLKDRADKKQQEK